MFFKKANQPKPLTQDAGNIELSSEIVHELFHLVIDGNKTEAINRVMQMTGAGLRAARIYVDSLEKRR